MFKYAASIAAITIALGGPLTAEAACLEAEAEIQLSSTKVPATTGCLPPTAASSVYDEVYVERHGVPVVDTVKVRVAVTVPLP